MNLIAYTRVSSDGQLDGFGIATQERAIAAWTKANGHRIIRTVSDVGVSGATDAVDRPGLSAALEALDACEAHGLVIARLDRLARALTVQEAALAFIWRTGAEVFTADAGQCCVTTRMTRCEQPCVRSSACSLSSIGEWL